MKFRVESRVMNINTYLQRIGYKGSLEPTLETLRTIHRQHLLTIPYENLDIHLGRTLELNEERFFEKIVVEKRGGWCYEMNGLLAWGLRELGFNVQYLSGAVNREKNGAKAEGNHLVLLIYLEQSYLADVGFGDGILEPLPLQEGEYKQDFLEFRLSQDYVAKDGGRWVFHNHPEGGAKSFDFTLTPHQLSDFANQCHTQQTSPNSGFVQGTVCQIFTPEGIVTLRGAVLKIITKDGVTHRIIDSEKEYQRILYQTFGLELPSVRDLYVRVWQRHLDWLASGGVI
jgi:N-hydroxyarylamine O-acetyltransferase